MNGTQLRRKAAHRCCACGAPIPEESAHAYCSVCLDYRKEKAAALRIDARERGLCGVCRRPNPDAKEHATCPACRAKMREYQRKRRGKGA